MAGDELDRSGFALNLSELIKAKARNHLDDEIIVLGDFNILPGERLLRKPKHIHSSLFRKEYNYFRSMGRFRKDFFNPILECIISNNIPGIFGTYFNKRDPFQLEILDYPLIFGEINNYQVEIVNRISTNEILTSNNGKFSLVAPFDHLPIKLTIQDDGK